MRRAAWMILLPLTLSAGCPSANDDDEHVCGDLSRAMTYVAGLRATGTDGLLGARLLQASPAPPDVGDNTWSVQIVDMQDGNTPLAGCTGSVDPLMPDHGHGSASSPTWTEDVEPGSYTVGGMDLFMPGYWEITLALDCAGVADTIVYGFCAEG